MRVMRTLAVLLFAAVGMRTQANPAFDAASPVWVEGRETRMNDFVEFRTQFVPSTGDSPVLRVTGSSVYRAWLNGKFLGYGPARAAKGFFRVDEWPLATLMTSGTNTLSVEVSAYNCNTYYICDWPAFLQAEVVAGGRVLARTGVDGSFHAYDLPRVTKVSRFSFQRGFGEAYRSRSAGASPLSLAARPPVSLLPRRAPYPNFTPRPPMAAQARTQVRRRASFDYRPVRQVDKVGGIFKAYAPDELEVNLWRELQSFETTIESCPSPTNVYVLAESGIIFDNGREETGFPMVRVTCRKPGVLFVAFDEVLTDGQVNPLRFEVANAVRWELKPGVYNLEAFEPYSFRYAHIFAVDGEMEVEAPRTRPYENPAADKARFSCSDPAVERIFEAARATFAQNAVDGFMDCPSRERAGWLCDSFFTGRASFLFTGSTELEKLFLENYLLPESFDGLPNGALPMCYPADHPNGIFIPNWMMWFVLEVDEYAQRSDDRTLVDALKPRLLALYDYLSGFRNADGLLERLPSWIFVEWSHANDLVRDVNYPSNMTWAEVLDALDRLYGRPDLRAEATRIRETVRRQAWTGKWFCDNAVRQADGSLKLSGECTETCQYYAFMFGTATPATHPELWRTLVRDFGPKRYDPVDRKKLLAHPEIAPSNAFIGNYLRLELLSRAGLSEQLLEETKGYLTYMVERTGTLWEHDGACASCNHGFASHAAVFYVRSLLGLASVDPRAKTFVAKPPRTSLTACSVSLPVPGGTLSYGWTRDGESFSEKVSTPPAWRRQD